MPDLGILHSAAVEIKASTRLREVLKVSPHRPDPASHDVDETGRTEYRKHA